MLSNISSITEADAQNETNRTDMRRTTFTEPVLTKQLKDDAEAYNDHVEMQSSSSSDLEIHIIDEPNQNDSNRQSLNVKELLDKKIEESKNPALTKA